MAEIIKGETGDWEIVIGMEVHAQIITKSMTTFPWLTLRCRECYPS
jgi:hypothetical protein